MGFVSISGWVPQVSPVLRDLGATAHGFHQWNTASRCGANTTIFQQDGDEEGDKGVWMSVWVDDVDEMHKHCLAAGLKVTFPPTEIPWHVRECTFAIPMAPCSGSDGDWSPRSKTRLLCRVNECKTNVARAASDLECHLFGGNFQSMRYQRAFGVLTTVLCCLGAASAQIMEVQADGVTCMHSGLSSDLRHCDVPDWYAYAFVGSISSVTPIENGESEIQIAPEEIFHGDLGTSVTVRTSQGACLPKLAVGDRWLFFLRKGNGNPIVLDYYGNDSRPVAEAQEKIEMLRRLQSLGDLGILRGHVQRGSQSLIEGEPVPSAHVIARRTPDNTRFVATTDRDGRYEFQPVPPGKYKLTLDVTDSPHAADGELNVSRGSCWDLTFSLPKKTDGSISGHIGSPDGKPFVVHPWVQIVSLDDEGFMSAYVDANGDFEMKGVKPSRYMVGVGIKAGTGGRNVPSPIYYPGVRTKEQAAIVDLRPAEKRTHIDFQLPIEDVLKPLGQATSKR